MTSEVRPGVYAFHLPDVASSWSEVELDLTKGTMKSRLAPSIAGEALATDAKAKNYGPITGYEWHSESGTADSGDLSVVSLKVAQVTNSGRWLLDYRGGQAMQERRRSTIDTSCSCPKNREG